MPDILSRPVVLPQTRENICTALIGQLTFDMSISENMVPRAGAQQFSKVSRLAIFWTRTGNTSSLCFFGKCPESKSTEHFLARQMKMISRTAIQLSAEVETLAEAAETYVKDGGNGKYIHRIHAADSRQATTPDFPSRHWKWRRSHIRHRRTPYETDELSRWFYCLLLCKR